MRTWPPDGVAVREEDVDYVRADEAGGAGYEDEAFGVAGMALDSGLDFLRNVLDSVHLFFFFF